MLKSVLAEYVDAFRVERDMDAPLLALLRAMGFTDIHFTHGAAEFGKDFIAKRVEDGVQYQYSLQAKHGSIGQSTFRNEIKGQLLEAVLLGLSHPSFDKSLPQRSVLVLSGRLSPNAAISLQDLNATIVGTYKREPVEVWDRETLIEHFTTFGPESIHASSSVNLKSYGNFFVLYGQAVRGRLDETAIEEHFSRVLDIEPVRARLLVSTLESQALSARCDRESQYYEGLFCHLANLRNICFELVRAATPEERAFLVEALSQQEQLIERHAVELYVWSKQAWEAGGRDLVKQIAGPAIFVGYPVTCARIMEIASLAYLYTSDDAVRSEIGEFILSFTATEPGAEHPVSDRFAVAIVLNALIHVGLGQREALLAYLRGVAKWLGDRYETGMGLSGLADTPAEAVERLLGYPFECIKLGVTRSSFLATALGDLAAFLGAKELYADLVNDFHACGIVPQYYQLRSDADTFDLDGPDILQYAHTVFIDQLTDEPGGGHADHIANELAKYAGGDVILPRTYMAVAVFLKDRYFPSLWSALVESAEPGRAAGPAHAVSGRSAPTNAARKRTKEV